MSYAPSEEILEKYAKILLHAGLGGSAGIKEGDVVWLSVPEGAKPLLKALHKECLASGAHPLAHLSPDLMARQLYENASDEQLSFFPEKYLRGVVDQIDHFVSIGATADPHELETIEPKKLFTRQRSMKPFRDWLDEKEYAGKLSWVLGLYGVQAMADEVDLSLEEYWQQIIEACYLDHEDPVKEWKTIFGEIKRVRDRLTALKIDKLHLESENADLWIGLGADREWLGGTGRNIPSYECYVSPDYRRTEGYIRFTEPLYRYGQRIENIYLRFEDGLVVEASADRGEKLLKEMISMDGADRVGEFSLTDSRLSRITRFMGETLYDENVGGEHGNTHLALGRAYKDSYPGDPEAVSEEEWDAMGYAQSIVHTDIMSTEPRTVTAHLADGTERVIYENGRFTV